MQGEIARSGAKLFRGPLLASTGPLPACPGSQALDTHIPGIISPSPAPESWLLASLVGAIHLPHMSSWRLTAFSASVSVVSVMMAKMRLRISASSIAMAATAGWLTEGRGLLAGGPEKRRGAADHRNAPNDARDETS